MEISLLRSFLVLAATPNFGKAAIGAEYFSACA
jgi:hypothetical protein